MSAFKDQRILVIGGSSGIGLATAHAFVKAEGDVTIASRSSNNLKAAAEIIQSDAGRKVTTSEFDVQDLGFVQAWFSERPPWNHVIVTGTQNQNRVCA
jgi:Dehydrogenases with different specificities (related to short-chain alcohol dehydrogenases)